MNLGIIQARMSSVRLPGKVLKEIRGVPILLMMIDRAKRSEMIDQLMVATSTDKTDDAIFLFCQKWNIVCFRGNLNDVLDRYWQCANSLSYKPDHIVRLTADCPLIDPQIIDSTIKYHLTGKYHYTYNSGFPDGLDVEIMDYQTLKMTWTWAKDDFEREHVTPYIRNNPNLFSIGKYESKIDYSGIKLSVDIEDDFERVSRIIDIAISDEGDLCLTQ